VRAGVVMRNWHSISVARFETAIGVKLKIHRLSVGQVKGEPRSLCAAGIRRRVVGFHSRKIKFLLKSRTF
jgi:hypothetical protein